MPERGRAIRNAAIALAVGALALVAVLAVTLTHAPPHLVRIGAPGVRPVTSEGVNTITTAVGDAYVCQSGEVLPSGVSAIRVSLWGFFGSPVRVTVYEGSRLLTEGRRGADWSGDSVTVPIRPLSRTVSGVKVCTMVGPNSQPIGLLGTSVPQEQATIAQNEASAGRALGLHARLTLEYLAAGQGSWWSRITAVARHLGLGRSFSGTWIAVLVAALMAAVAALTVRLTLRELP